MTKNYTLFNEQSISDYTSADADSDAIEFLKNPDNFRPFNQGLIELLKKKNFQGDIDSYSEASDYLISKLRHIQSDIAKETVYSWFSGEHRPKVEPGSRRRMYEICFSLELSYKETVWFFHHVYYDRCFNCHTIEEAVFYYSFLHGISYQEALRMIKAINDSAPTETVLPEEPDSNYTQFIQENISDIKTPEELQEFLIARKQTFHSWNNRAFKEIKRLLSEITGDKSSKPIIDELRHSLARNIRSNKKSNFIDEMAAEQINSCGLLIRELFHDAQLDAADSASKYISDTIAGKHIFKNTFVLDRLLCTFDGVPQNTNIPYIVKNNFPSKKVMSDVLDETKVITSKSYDSIRKLLVLLDFYVFWVSIKLGISNVAGFDTESLFQIYRDEADSLLYQCGYEPLYAGNPYDWLFLCSAKNEEPLEFFRDCIGELML